MTDSLKKVRGVKHLPLFPLPVVLFPGELMPLHIFEPRYRQMLRDIKLEKSLFGLSYFNAPDSASTRPKVGSLGCAAEVRESQTQEDGRSNILTVGVARYVLENYVDTDEPYAVSEVSFFEDDAEDQEILNSLSNEVTELFTRAAGAVGELSGERAQRLPDFSQAAPEELSFLIASAFNLNADLKYELLQTRSTIKRLERLREILKQSVGKIEEAAQINKIAKSNGHSKKKINF